MKRSVPLSLATVLVATAPVAHGQIMSESILVEDVPSSENAAGTVLRSSSQSLSSQVTSGIQTSLGGATRGVSVTSADGTPNTHSTRGLAAGGSPGVGVWGNIGWTDSSDEFSRSAYDSELVNYLAGIDVAYGNNVVFGVAGGYEDNDVETTFNSGTQEIEGYTIAPYVGVMIAPNVSIDVALGYTKLETEQRRVDGNGNTSFSQFDSDRIFVAGNLRGIYSTGNWTLTGIAGLLFSEEEQDGFTESNGNVVGERRLNLLQGIFGGEAAYGIGRWEPYASALARLDIDREDVEFAAGTQHSNDDRELQVGAGARYYGDQFTLAFSWDTSLFRRDYNAHSLGMTVRGEF